MRPMLRQLAIAMSPEGIVGVDNDLLFHSPTDMVNFALFTQHTVLISGRKTAEEMIDYGVVFKDSRPMIVISENNILSTKLAFDSRFIFYANDIKCALKMAEELSDRLQLNGYTVVGGASVYQEFSNMLDGGRTQVNRAYIFTAEIGEHELHNPVQLSRTSKQLRATIINRQTEPVSGLSIADVAIMANIKGGDASKGEKVENKKTPVRGKDCRFEWITDSNEFDTDAATVTGGGRLKLKLTTGVVTLRTQDISHWEERSGVNSVDIHMKNGQLIDARPSTVAGLNWIKATLNKIAY